jgi:hypothetical protein
VKRAQVYAAFGDWRAESESESGESESESESGDWRTRISPTRGACCDCPRVHVCARVHA